MFKERNQILQLYKDYTHFDFQLMIVFVDFFVSTKSEIFFQSLFFLILLNVI